VINFLKKYIYLILFVMCLSSIQSTNLYAEETTDKPHWKKACQVSGEVNEICQTSYGQYILFNEENLWVSRIGIAVLNDSVMRMFVYGPLGVLLAEGVNTKIDDLPVVRMDYVYCINLYGCQAILEIDNTAVNNLKNGNEIIIEFLKPTGETLTANVSLAGFTKAFNSN
jgi:invasion protein IalB